MSIRSVDQKECCSEVSIRKMCGSEVLIRYRSKVSLRGVNQKCRSGKLSLRSVDQVSVKIIAQKCQSKVSIRKSVAQKCCSEVSIRESVVQKC